MVKLKVKKGATVYKQYAVDAGYDLSASEKTTIPAKGFGSVGTNLYVQIPVGYEGKTRPRSGAFFKHGIEAFIGTIDASYRGEVRVGLKNWSDKDFEVNVGDRVAQLVVSPCLIGEVEYVDELDPTDRGEKGFGSSGGLGVRNEENSI